MTERSDHTQTRSRKVGWVILLVVSALMLLNGVVWFFVGPRMMLSYTAQIAGVPLEEFERLYPAVVEHLPKNTRQVAIWYAAFGSMALMVALEGLRRGSRWAWYASWAVVAAPMAIGLVYYAPGDPPAFDNVGLFTFGAVALAGQLLARPRRGRGTPLDEPKEDRK